MPTGYVRQDTTGQLANGSPIDADLFNDEYNAIVNAFNASSGHNHDGTTGGGGTIDKVGPSQELEISSSAVFPKISNLIDLGKATLMWKNGYFDGTLSTDILSVDETSTFTGNVTTVADVAIGGNLTVTGNATINGNLTLGDAASDNVSFGADINSHIIPNTDNTFDLGSTIQQWRNIYIDGVAYLDEVDIDAGAIDGTAIGANSASTGAFTTLAASGAATLSDALTVTGATALNGGLTMDTNKFTVANGTGNTAIAGTLGVTGATTMTGALTASGGVTGNLTGNVTGNVTGNTSGSSGSCTGNAATATALANARTITLGGDLSGSVSFDGSSNVTLSGTVAANSVALGTDTTGNYAADVDAGAGITVTGSAGEGTTFTVAHADTSSQATSSNSGTTFIQSLTLDTYGHVTGVGTGTASGGGGSFTGGTGITISGTTINCSIDAPSEVGLGNLSNNGNNLSGSFTATGDITAFSDERLKENVETIEGALDKVSQMRGVTYNYKSELNDGQRGTGVIAQEMQKVMPEVIHDGEYLSVAYGNLVGVLIEAVKELKAEVEELKNKNQ